MLLSLPAPASPEDRLIDFFRRPRYASVSRIVGINLASCLCDLRDDRPLTQR